MSQFKELDKILSQPRSSSKTEPVTSLEPISPNASQIIDALMENADDYGNTITKHMPVFALEGVIDTSPLFSEDIIDPVNPPHIRVVKFRHSHNFEPNVKPHPLRISPNPTPFEIIHGRNRLDPKDVLKYTVESRPDIGENPRQKKRYVIRAEVQGWGAIDQSLLQQVITDPTSVGVFKDDFTNRTKTSLSSVYNPTETSINEIIENESKKLKAMTPLVGDHHRFWSVVEEETNQEQPDNVISLPTKSIATSIHTARQLNRGPKAA